MSKRVPSIKKYVKNRPSFIKTAREKDFNIYELEEPESLEEDLYKSKGLKKMNSLKTQQICSTPQLSSVTQLPKSKNSIQQRRRFQNSILVREIKTPLHESNKDRIIHKQSMSQLNNKMNRSTVGPKLKPIFSKREFSKKRQKKQRNSIANNTTMNKLQLKDKSINKELKKEIEENSENNSVNIKLKFNNIKLEPSKTKREFFKYNRGSIGGNVQFQQRSSIKQSQRTRQNFHSNPFNQAYYTHDVKKVLKKFQNGEQLDDFQYKVLQHVKENYMKFTHLKRLGVSNVERVLPFKLDLHQIKHNIKVRRYLFLDLDETLVYASKNQLHPNSFKLNKPNTGWVTPRPYLQQFLQEVSKNFNIIIYTAAESFYAEQVIQMIDPGNKFFIIKLYRQNCVYIQHGIFLKLMKFLHNLNLRQTLFVDNSPFHLYETPDYGIPIIPFHGETEDTELLKLMMFLKSLKGEYNLANSVKDKFKIREYLNHNTFDAFVESLI